MFKSLMPPGQEDVIEDHYEEIPMWESESIVCTCITELLHGLMDIQYMPSKELASVYFDNNDISQFMTGSMREIESIEMVKCFPEQLEKAFCLAFADKLLIASTAIRKILKKRKYLIMITKQLKEVVKHSYLQDKDMANFRDNVRQLWMEFQIDINTKTEEQRPSDWYYCSDKDPYYENVIRDRVSMNDIKTSLVGLEKALRTSTALVEHLPSLKSACMHLLMIASSIRPRENPTALTQSHYNSICDFVLDVNVDAMSVWTKPEDIDLAQVVMARHLSRAARKVAKFERPTGNIVIQNLLSWFAIETYVAANKIRHMHGKNRDSEPEVASSY